MYNLYEKYTKTLPQRDISMLTAYLKNDVLRFLLVLCHEQEARSLTSSKHHAQICLIRHVGCFLVELLFEMPFNEALLTKVLRCRCYEIKQKNNLLNNTRMLCAISNMVIKSKQKPVKYQNIHQYNDYRHCESGG